MSLLGEDFLIYDTGVLSRILSNKPLLVEAHQLLRENNVTAIISPTIYIELTYWLIKERGRVGGTMTKSDFDKNRKLLDQLPLLNNEAVADTAVTVAKQFPDTGLGDCFTIGVGLVFDVPIFTLNPKHFDRVTGVRLYKPDNYTELLRST